MWKPGSDQETVIYRAAKKRREPTGGNLHTCKWHAWCRNEDHAYA